MTRQSTTRQEWLQFWEDRELSFLAALAPVLLVVATIVVVTTRTDLRGGLGAALGLSGASAVWLTLAPAVQRRNDRAVVMVPLFAVLVALLIALVFVAPLYGFYTFTGYFWVFRLLPGRLRLAGVASVAMASAISQTGAGPYDTLGSLAALAGVYAINAGVAGTVTWFAWIGSEQNDRRRQVIDELQEANARLQDSLRENAELQERLVAQAREAGVAAERRRMAREIHDTLAQGLAGIITQLQAAERAGAGDGAGARHAAHNTARARHLEAAMGLARESLTEARRSVDALAPEALDRARLPEAMQEVAARWSQLHRVPVAVTTTGTARVMRPEIEVALLRTAQEALANVAKHAAARRVGLTLSYMEDLVTLDVRDDGVGFSPDSAVSRTGNGNGHGARGGFGLHAMRQRVEGVSGTLQVESEPDAGTAICAAVPAVPASVSR